MTSPQDDWVEYRRLVLAELQRLSEVVRAIQKDVGDIKSDLAVTRNELNLKAGIWGALAAMVPAGVAVIFILMRDAK